MGHAERGRDDAYELDDYYEVAAPGAGGAVVAAGRGDPADGQADRPMRFYTRKWIRPEDLNANGTLFGGSLLKWIDEEATIYTIVQLGNPRVVTKLISEINFVSSAQQGDLVEMGLRATAFGTTSVTMQAQVRNMVTRASILTIDRLVFVSLGEDGRPARHGFTEVTYERDRFPGAGGRAGTPEPPVPTLGTSVDTDHATRRTGVTGGATRA